MGSTSTTYEPVWPNFLWRRHNYSTQCEPIQTKFSEPIDKTEIQLLFSVLYFIVWLSAILGNLIVLYMVTLKQLSVSSVRTVFICNLAINDIVMSVTSLPITAVTIFTRDWVFPKVLCKLVNVFQGGSVFVSSFTLTAIAVDRYFLIRYPANQKVSYGMAVTIVVLIWIFGYVFASPSGIVSVINSYGESQGQKSMCGVFCEESWPDEDETPGPSEYRKFYGTLVLVIQFGLPLIISSICYWLISRIIRSQIEKRKKQQTLLESNQQKLESRKSRSSRMMITMVGGLVLAWLPMNLVNLWRDYFMDMTDSSRSYSLIFASCHVVAMTSAVWNPIIYSWFNPQFRSTLKNAFARNAQMSRRYNAMQTEI